MTEDFELADRFFAERWRAISWEGAKEVDVREELFTPLLSHLGYARGTLNDIVREEPFTLPQPFIMIGRRRLQIDYSPRVRLKRFFIAETKSPQDPLDYEVLSQALIYAAHPDVRARYVAICNGRRLEVFRVDADSYDAPQLAIDQTNVTSESIGELRTLLGAKTVAATLRVTMLEVLRETIDVEVDEQAIPPLAQELNRMMREAHESVRQNAQEARSNAWRRQSDMRDAELRSASWEELMVAIDVPLCVQKRYGEEVGRRLIAASPIERRDLADRLAMKWRGRPHGICRVHSMTAVLSLLTASIDLESTTYVRSVAACIDELSIGASTYYAHNAIANALCHLDNAATRVGYKLALKTGADMAGRLLAIEHATMAAADRLQDLRSPAGLTLSVGGLLGEKFWRGYCSASDSGVIVSGVWDLIALEDLIDKLPEVNYPPGDGSAVFLEYYGLGFDMLRMGTWDMLTSAAPFDTSGLSPETVAFMNLSREDALAGIPLPLAKPVDWSPQGAHVTLIFDYIRSLLS